MNPLRRTTLVALALIAIPTVASLVLWPTLPAEMAVHFGPGGEPDNYLPKAVALSLVPAIGVGLIVFMALSPRIDPTADLHVLGLGQLFAAAVLAFVHGLTLGWNLGYRFDMTVAVALILGGAALLCAYAVGREYGWFPRAG